MKGCSISLVSVSIMFSLASPAIGEPITVAAVTNVPYDVRHTFNTRLVGNQVYRGAWQWFDHAIAKGKDFKRDDQTRQGNERFAPPAGPTTKTAPAISPTATAKANSQFQAMANGMGFSRVFGGGTLGDGTYVASEASTTVALNRGVTARNGSITWSPNWSFITAATGRLGDPIDVGFLDLDDSTTVTSRLFDLNIAFGQGGSSTYSDGDLAISGLDGTFSLVMDSPYITSGVGTIDIEFLGGLVTHSVGTGIFSAVLLPGIGSSSLAAGFHLGDASGAFDIDFDFGSVPGNVNGFDAQVQYGTSAFVEALAPVPEPASLTLLGLGIAGLIARQRAKRKPQGER